MAQRAFSFDALSRLCIDGVPVLMSRGYVFKIAGGSPDGDEGGDGGSDSDDSGSGGDSGTGSEGQGNEGNPSGDGDSKDKPVTQADLDAITRRMQAADRRAEAAEKKVKEHEDANKNELQKATERAAELEAANTKLTEKLTDQVVRNAFLSENSVTWHDPDLAYREIRSALGDDVEPNAQGKIPGLTDAVKKLAKEKAWMVKTEAPNGPSGEPQNGNRKGEKSEKDKAALKGAYPALRR